MTLSKLSAACAVACAAMAGQAYAQTPAPFSAPDETVYLSGATAPDNFIAQIVTAMYEPGFWTFLDNVATPGNDFRAWYGRVRSTADIPAAIQGKNIVLIKRRRGGSVWGVNPVARAQRVAVIDRAAPSCTLAGATTYNCSVKGIDPGLTDYSDPANAGIVPDFGVSDVEAAMFKGPYNVEFGQSQLSAAETAQLTPRAVNTLMMGLVATRSVPADTYLSRGNYGAMLTGLLQDWGQINPAITSGNTQVIVCRRVQGSGTQASYNWFFSNFPCQGQFAGTVAPTRMELDSASGITGGSGTEADPFTIDPTAGYTVVENSGSGDVRNCLQRAATNVEHKIRGDNGSWYAIQFQNTPTVPFRAIGTLSLDSSPQSFPTAGSAQWTFRYLDGAGEFDNNVSDAGALVAGPGTGIAPSKNNLKIGKYDFAVELAMQYRNVTVTNEHGDVVPQLAASGMKFAMADQVITRSGSPTFNTVRWTAALPPTNIPSLDLVTGIPTNNVARSTRGGNTCKPLQQLF